MNTNQIPSYRAIQEVSEADERRIRREWANRGFNGWWKNTDHSINVDYNFYPEIYWTVGNHRKPETMIKITGCKTAVHAIATYEAIMG